MCHKPSYRVLGSTAELVTNKILTAFLYSDLLLHDMGPGLADGFEQGTAGGSDRLRRGLGEGVSGHPQRPVERELRVEPRHLIRDVILCRVA